MRELDIRQREADNDADRIKTNAALAENMRGLRESNDSIARQFAASTAQLEESKVRSRAMGETVEHTDGVVTHTAEVVDKMSEQVDEMAVKVRDTYNMLNRKGEANA